MSSELVDAVIVGFGGAGAAAAITAHDLGANVVVLEKAESGGGSTAVSGGNIRLLNDAAGAIRHFSSLCGPATPPEVIAAYVAGLATLPDWLRGLGGELVPHDQNSRRALSVVREGSGFPGAPDADAIGSRVQIARPATMTGGQAIWQLLASNVARRNVPVEYGVRVSRLLRSAAGRITGVEILHGRSARKLRSRGGVVLACGGFAWAPGLHLDQFGAVLPALSPPDRNTGDGIRLAQEVGAQLWHMSAIAARFGLKAPGYQAAFTCDPPSQGVFLVDQTGRRFMNETGVSRQVAGLCMLDRDPGTGRMARCPSYLIFDETTRLKGPFGDQISGYNYGYQWSHDNSAELERGWIIQADSIPGLAKTLGLPVDWLGRTASRYNAACETGDDDWGRTPETMEAVVKPPFYAVPVWPCLLNTQGGPRRSARAEVLDVHGQPIPGLYSAGELGSMWGPLYPGAGNLTEALVTGQLAARSVTAAL
jgi:succinate dehydrogenase/fumarate reductase flavoprotein subunit